MIQIKPFKIGKRMVGPGQPCFIIAEISANHRQQFDKAVAIIEATAKAGADAIKLQTYTPDTLTLRSTNKWFIVKGKDQPDTWKHRNLYDLYKDAYTPWEWQPKLKRIAETLGMVLFSTPFDESAVDFLETMNVPCYKIASYEAIHIPLLKKVAKTKKPVIISVGFASLSEVRLAITTLRKHGARDIAVLHCVTAYSDLPRPKDANLQTILDLAERFKVLSGFSDNNAGIDIPVTAALMGAHLIEKHIILKRSDEGPDARFSLEPEELKQMIERIRAGEQARGKIHYGPASAKEKENMSFRPSIWVKRDIKKGERFSRDTIRVARPSAGLAPRFFEKVLGKKATRDIAFATPLLKKHIVSR